MSVDQIVALTVVPHVVTDLLAVEVALLLPAEAAAILHGTRTTAVTVITIDETATAPGARIVTETARKIATVKMIVKPRKTVTETKSARVCYHFVLSTTPHT